MAFTRLLVALALAIAAADFPAAPDVGWIDLDHPEDQSAPTAATRRALFYWYTPAASGDAAAPTLVWLNGGPGSTSFIGSFSGLGPYTLDPAAAEPSDALAVRADGAWSAFANLLVVDNPVGVGYSFVAANASAASASAASADAGYCATQECVGADFVGLLEGFYARHAELDARGSPLFLTGERATPRHSRG